MTQAVTPRRTAGASSDQPALLQLKDVTKRFPLGHPLGGRTTRSIRAVDGINLTLYRGDTLGLVGESGSGKSTTARLAVRLLQPTSGQIIYDGADITRWRRRQLRPFRRECQMVFQDPFGSLDSRMTVGAIVAEPMKVHGRHRGDRAERVAELLETVGLSPEHAYRFPHEFSGGQRQRVGIARALALDPTLLVLDEPVSALDVSIQAQILNLLKALQERLGLSYLLIAHDLAVVRHVSRQVAVMYLGKIVEVGPQHEVFNAPAHPYTQALVSAIPIMDPARRDTSRRIVLPGDPPDPADPPSGCRFRTRCWKAAALCSDEEPALRDRTGDGRLTACHFAEPGSTSTSTEEANP